MIAGLVLAVGVAVSAMIQAPRLFQSHDGPAVFNPPSKSVVYVDDGSYSEPQASAPVCVDFCDNKGDNLDEILK
jgi:hypothetical protein